MKKIRVVWGFAVMVLFVGMVHAGDFSGTYAGLYYPDGGYSPHDMVLSVPAEGTGVATFYNAVKGTRKMVSGMDVKFGVSTIDLHKVLEGGRERVFSLAVSPEGVITGRAFEGIVNLKQVDTKACSADAATKIIVAPC